MNTFDISVNNQQLALIDAHVQAHDLASRDALAARAIAEATPAGPHPVYHRPGREVPSQSERRVLEEHTIEPGTGKAVVVRAGSLLRVEQIEGGQCADFNVYALDNWHENMHLGRTRSLHGKSPRDGDLVWSRAPWERPMLAILRDTGQTDTLVPYCSALLYWRLFGQRQHTNCQQIQIEAQREFGIPPYAVHESLNLFMYVDQDETGEPVIQPNYAGSDDYIEFYALMDVLAVVNVCGDDMGVTSNFELRDLHVEVLKGTEADREAAEASVVRDHPYGLLPHPYTIEPAPLSADPDYVPAFPHAPVVKQSITIALSDEDTAELRRLAKPHLYGDDLSRSLRDLILTWVTTVSRVEQ
nr:urea carboxylase-associated family protein [uncultured Actinomyces sp.]